MDPKKTKVVKPVDNACGVTDPICNACGVTDPICNACGVDRLTKPDKKCDCWGY
jgi:hypothetical protein